MHALFFMYARLAVDIGDGGIYQHKEIPDVMTNRKHLMSERCTFGCPYICSVVR